MGDKSGRGDKSGMFNETSMPHKKVDISNLMLTITAKDGHGGHVEKQVSAINWSDH